MARSKRNSRRKNKIDGLDDGAMVQPSPDPLLPEVPAQVARPHAVAITRSTMFTADFEALVELIAIDRVYRMMLERRRITPPAPPLPAPPEAEDA